jgi:hypothetical protein
VFDDDDDDSADSAIFSPTHCMRRRDLEQFPDWGGEGRGYRYMDSFVPSPPGVVVRDLYTFSPSVCVIDCEKKKKKKI